MKKILFIIIILLLATPCYAMKQIFLSSDSANMGSTTQYNYPIGGSVNWLAAESQRKQVIPIASTLSSLRISISVAPGSGKSRVFTIRKNGSATSLSCTISDTNTSCEDITNSVSLVAGDYISLEQAPSGTPTAGRWKHSVLFENSGSNISVLIGGSGNNASAMATETWPPLHGGGGEGTTASNRTQTLLPISGTLSNLYINCVGPSAGNTWTFTALKNGVSQSLSCSMTNPTKTCNDTTHSFSFSAGDIINIYTVANTASQDPGLNCGVSAVVTGSVNGEYIIAAASSAATTTSTRYQWVQAGQSTINATESNAQQYLSASPYSLVFKAIYAWLESAPGSGQSYVFTFRSNSSNTGLSTTISDTATTSNYSTNTSLANEALYSSSIVPSVSPAVGRVSIAYKAYLNETTSQSEEFGTLPFGMSRFGTSMFNTGRFN